MNSLPSPLWSKKPRDSSVVLAEKSGRAAAFVIEARQVAARPRAIEAGTEVLPGVQAGVLSWSLPLFVCLFLFRGEGRWREPSFGWF